jgi:TolA-binding protein
VLGFLLAMSGCAATQTAYERNAQAAIQAYERGEYARAAEFWDAAKRVAESDGDRDEARYRAARSLLRAGRPSEARALLGELAASGRGERAARASYDLAFHEIAHGDVERGHELLRAALLRFPDHGVARDALRRRRAHWVATHGSETAERDLAELGRELSGTELESTAWFERAKLLEARAERTQALAAYRDVARRFPYPHGVYWNDAVLAAARLELRLGQTRAARESLLGMLDRRESAALTGSYERKYDEASFLLAEIELQEGLWRVARQRFLDLVADYPWSRLCDDALWAAAVISARQHDQSEACHLAARLRLEAPNSRFVACEGLVCRSHERTEDRCADYVERAFHRGELRPEPTFD